MLDLYTPSTIDLQAGTSDEFRLIACQKQAVVRHIWRLSKSSKRDIKEKLLHVLFIVRHAHKRLEPE